MLRILLPLLVLGAAVHPLAAQALPDSTRVRITAPRISPGRPLIGTVQSVDAWGVVLREERGGAVMTIPRNVIEFAEVSRGRITSREGAARGLRTGALVGSLLGIAGGLGVAVGQNVDLADDDPDRKDLLAEGAKGLAIGGIPGALLGWVIGGTSRERWEQVGVPQLMVGREDGAVSVSVRVIR